MSMSIIQRALLLFMAVVLGFVVFELGPGTLFSWGPLSRNDSGLPILIVVLLTLVAPRKYVWLTLAMWASYCGFWTIYEYIHLVQGDNKFGPMLIPYGIATLILSATSVLSSKGWGGMVKFRKG